jgi:hypothetical protein
MPLSAPPDHAAHRSCLARATGRILPVVAYTFDLVPIDGDLRMTESAFNKARFLLSESQPAVWVRLMTDPPRIRVRAQGRVAEVAPGLLAQVEELAELPLEVVHVRRW